MIGTFDTKTIEEVIENLIDYRGKTPRKTDGGVKLITAKVIKDGRILDDNHEYIAEGDYDSWMRRGLPHQWDILITTEAPLGEVAMLRTPEKIALAQRVILLRGNPEHLNQRYFFQCLKSPFVKAELNARATGTTVLGIKQSELRQVRVPFFPLNIQEKIASILSAYDDLIENNIRRIRILEEMAQAIYREWFVHFRFPGHEKVKMVDSPLGKIPEGWPLVKVPQVIEINPHERLPKDTTKYYVAMEGLSNASMIVTVTEKRVGNSGSKFRNGDTLFARITPCLENGKTGFVQFLPSQDTVGIGSTEFIVLRSRTLCPEFVYLLSRDENFRGNAIKSMSGASGRQRVSMECFDKYCFAHPDQDILKLFKTTICPIFPKIQILADKNTNLRQTRDLLLPRLISGEVDVSKMDIVVPEETAT